MPTSHTQVVEQTSNAYLPIHSTISTILEPLHHGTDLGCLAQNTEITVTDIFFHKEHFIKMSHAPDVIPSVEEP